MCVTSSPKSLQHNLRRTEFSPRLNPLEARGVKLTRGSLSLAVNKTVCTNSPLASAAMYSALLELDSDQGLIGKGCPLGGEHKDAQKGTQVPQSSRTSRPGDWPTSTCFSFIQENEKQNKCKKKKKRQKRNLPNYAVFNFAFPLIPIYQVSSFKIGREVKLRW